jgi:hypothetical protein
MDHRWYFLTLVPAVLLGALALVPAVRLQPCLTSAGTKSRFDAIVDRSGGPHSVRSGFYLDFLFIAVFVATVPAVLYVDHRWWPVPVVTAALDVTEDTLALHLLESSASTIWFKALRVLAAVKLAGYGLTVVVIGWGVISALR